MKKQGSSKLNILLTTLLLVLFGVVLVFVMFLEAAPAAPAADPSTVPTGTVRVTVPETTLPAVTVPPETTLPAPRRVNFLLVGRDWHDEDENGRSDTMMLCSFDTGSNTVTMISFLRDIYLKIPGHSSSRLNAAYSWGGRELLNETLTENFGVQIDVNLEIDFDGFEAIIDQLGGVDIDLTDREASYLNNHYGWTLSEGLSHLDGSQALAYSRIRYLDSDFVRTQRQRNVMMSLLERFRTAGLQEILRITDLFLDESTSDHTDEELLALALELYPSLRDCQIVTQQIPADDTYSYATIRGMSVIEVDLDANIELLCSLLADPE